MTKVVLSAQGIFKAGLHLFFILTSLLIFFFLDQTISCGLLICGEYWGIYLFLLTQMLEPVCTRQGLE